MLYRAHPADLEVRSAGRTIVGLAVPFDVPARVSDGSRHYTELFRRGAFRRTIAERGPSRIKSLVMHDRQRLPIGRAEVLREDPNGLYAELRVSKTAFGDEILELVRDGALDGLSIGFEPVAHGDRWSRDRDTCERIEVRLREISVVDAPAYADAVISAVRAEAAPQISADVLRRRLQLLEGNL